MWIEPTGAEQGWGGGGKEEGQERAEAVWRKGEEDGEKRLQGDHGGRQQLQLWP